MEWKYATIFISSSFIDMHAERDYLIKKVFPELEEWCEKHKIHLSNIDLRWGVPEDVSNNNSTIEKCLLNIDKSRPFFLCFLGQPLDKYHCFQMPSIYFLLYQQFDNA